MTTTHPVRHLLRARDHADACFAEPLTVADLARVAGLSPAHFSRQFRAAFGESPHTYLLTRRVERAAALLRSTEHSVAEICMLVGLSSVGSFTASFTRLHGRTPTQYRAGLSDDVRWTRIPPCVLHAYSRPANRTFGEARGPGAYLGSSATTDDDEEPRVHDCQRPAVRS